MSIKKHWQEEMEKTDQFFEKLYKAIDNDDIDTVARLAQSINPRTFNSHFNQHMYLELAQEGKTQMFKLLYPLVAQNVIHGKTQNNYALQRACESSNMELIEFLAPVCDVASNGCRAIKYAVHNQNEQIVEFLAPFHQNQKISLVDQNVLLYYGVDMDNIKILKSLLTFLDPTIEKSFALQLASAQNKHEVIDILYPLSNVDEAIQDASHDVTNLIIRRKAEQEKEILEHTLSNQNIGSETPRKTGKKI